MEATEVRLVAPPTSAQPHALPSDATRLSEMATRHFQFIWRSLRRLGVAEQSVDDAAQQVFVLAAEKIEQIVPGCERAFLFQTALRVAMSVRRTYAQRREALLGEELEELVDGAPLPDASLEKRQMRKYLDELLDALPMDLRAVFVLFEIEGVESPEIASILEIPVGTVASRLRRAREGFRAEAGKLRARLARRSER